jgi:Protein of unknown function (DUF3558)
MFATWTPSKGPRLGRWCLLLALPLLAACAAPAAPITPVTTAAPAAGQPTSTASAQPTVTSVARTPAAASASPSAQASANDVDPCSLITKAEAEAALGEPVQEPKVTTLGMRTCSFLPVKESLDKRIVSVGVQRAGGPNLDAIKQVTSETANTAPVPGIGEKAVWEKGGVDELWILQGNALIRVVVSTPAKPESVRLDAAKHLAQSVLGRLS